MARVNPTPVETQPQWAADRVKAQLEMQAEMDRLVPEGTQWRKGFECRICGASVANQVRHFLWHTEDADSKMAPALAAILEGEK